MTGAVWPLRMRRVLPHACARVAVLGSMCTGVGAVLGPRMLDTLRKLLATEFSSCDTCSGAAQRTSRTEHADESSDESNLNAARRGRRRGVCTCTYSMYTPNECAQMSYRGNRECGPSSCIAPSRSTRSTARRIHLCSSTFANMLDVRDTPRRRPAGTARSAVASRVRGRTPTAITQSVTVQSRRFEVSRRRDSQLLRGSASQRATISRTGQNAWHEPAGGPNNS